MASIWCRRRDGTDARRRIDAASRARCGHDALIIQNRFPGTVVWFGCYTRRWWAMAGITGRAQLFEGADPDEITGAIINSLGFA